MTSMYDVRWKKEDVASASQVVNSALIRGRIFGACRNTPKGTRPLPHGSYVVISFINSFGEWNLQCFDDSKLQIAFELIICYFCLFFEFGINIIVVQI